MATIMATMAITNKYGDIMLDIIGDNGDMHNITDWWLLEHDFLDFP